MLVLSRKTDQRIHIGDDITIVVSQIKGNRVTIGIEAPDGVRILRGELQGVAEEFDDEEAPPTSASAPPLFVTPDTANGLPGTTEFFSPRNAR